MLVMVKQALNELYNKQDEMAEKIEAVEDETKDLKKETRKVDRKSVMLKKIINTYQRSTSWGILCVISGWRQATCLSKKIILNHI